MRCGFDTIRFANGAQDEPAHSVWKRRYTRIGKLIALGIFKPKAVWIGRASKGPWRMANNHYVQQGLSNRYLAKGDFYPSRNFGSRLLQFGEPPCALKRMQGGVAGRGLKPPATRLARQSQSPLITCRPHH